MNPFERAERLASRQIDRAFAEPFTLTPMAGAPGGRRDEDPERPTVTGKGIFSNRTAEAPLELGNRDRRGNDFRTLVRGQRITLSVYRDVFEDALPQQGDLVEMTNRSRTYAVQSVSEDGASRIVLSLSEH
ncbi:hypothetical protein B7H23_12935 [Notoacmeibacter marinus]|uniref:Uncharacterized protein n=1 Tax=Notoacmeibacter marinus TaxID=1876515 RepID=A0A231UT43_9HYPH|nr:hypothetical protein [Notoacmeibacter marinus]OXS99104.1 hypothetical protein B7H23_12935 [Notoacmeibacter marinus]